MVGGGWGSTGNLYQRDNRKDRPTDLAREVQKTNSEGGQTNQGANAKSMGGARKMGHLLTLEERQHKFQRWGD